MRVIPLTNSYFARVDDEDYERVAAHRWYAHKSGTENDYVYAENLHLGRMQRFITDCPSNKVVDHINGNTLDNRRSNLRICTRSQNTKNNQKRRNTVCVFKGVIIDPRQKSNPYRARLRYMYKLYDAGYFSTEVMAAMAYDIMARDLFGEFATLNFPSALHG